jgi:hypothetical protein
VNTITLPINTRERKYSSESEKSSASAMSRTEEDEESLTLEDIKEKSKTSSAVINFLAQKLVNQEKVMKQLKD